MRIIFLFLVGLLFGLSACGERATPTPQPIVAAILQPLPPGDPAQGEKLFRRTLLGARPEPGCITCHSLAPATVLLGPSLADIATRSATTIQQADYQGQAESVEQYLQESISAPNVYLAPGFAPDVMRPTFAAELSPQEIADLVAFLLTLKVTPVAGKITLLNLMAPVAPIGMTNGSIYFTLQNGTDQPLHLQSARAAVAEAHSFHETVNDNGILRMSAQPAGFTVPAGESLVLAPGGKHLMLEKLYAPLVAGEQFTLTLTFTEGDPLIVTVPVMAHGAQPMEHHR